MINFRKAIAFGLAVASLGMGVAATSTPTVAEWDFQHRNLSSGFNNYDESWGPGVGGVPLPQLMTFMSLTLMNLLAISSLTPPSEKTASPIMQSSAFANEYLPADARRGLPEGRVLAIESRARWWLIGGRGPSGESI
jgi:hypothetical protein